MIPSLTAVESSLLENLVNPMMAYWEGIEEQANNLLQVAKAGTDIDVANKAWFLHKLAATRGRYVRCFDQVRQQQFYEAWCDLERVEIALSWLARNDFYDPEQLGVATLQRQVARWQSLYPYKVFFSPGILHKRKECSMCQVPIDPWTDCGHKVGYVTAVMSAMAISRTRSS